jgi:spore coat polysaccharide biosynthesis predicted glycosyltransferase SpsG
MRIEMRPSTGPSVGHGHAARCGVLGAELRRLGHDVITTAAPSPAAGVGLVVIDRRDDPSEEIERARRCGAAVAMICDRPWVGAPSVDVLISPGPQAIPELFVGCEAATLLLGPSHALVNPAFHRRQSAVSPAVRSVLLSLGGARHGDLLDRLADAARQHVEEVHVVRPGSLTPAEMVALAHRVDAAIVAAGVMSLEMGAAGLPCAVVSVADDQIVPAEAFARLGLAFNLGELAHVPTHHLVDDIAAFVGDHALRTRLVDASARTYREEGVHHVARAVLAAAQLAGRRRTVRSIVRVAA